MSFMELTAERYSSRKYSSKPVEKEKIDPKFCLRVMGA